MCQKNVIENLISMIVIPDSSIFWEDRPSRLSAVQE